MQRGSHHGSLTCRSSCKADSAGNEEPALRRDVKKIPRTSGHHDRLAVRTGRLKQSSSNKTADHALTFNLDHPTGAVQGDLGSVILDVAIETA